MAVNDFTRCRIHVTYVLHTAYIANDPLHDDSREGSLLYNVDVSFHPRHIKIQMSSVIHTI